MNRSQYLLWLGLVVFFLLLFSFRKILFPERYNWIAVSKPNYDFFMQRILPLTVDSTPHPRIHLFHGDGSGNTNLNVVQPGEMSVLVDAEPFPCPNRCADSYDLVITGKKDLATRPNVIYVAPWSYMLAQCSNWSIPDLLTRVAPPKKKRFCAFVYSNCRADMNGVRERERFFEILNRRKRVHAVGKCKYNLTEQDLEEDVIVERRKGDWDETIRHLQRYKFVIAFENTLDIAGYVTEKLIFPLLAGCVPIYLGHTPTVEQQFNTGCFIHVAKFPSYEACADYVMKVDQDAALYNTYLKSPIIQKEKLIEYASWYFGTQTFFKPFFRIFPRLFRSAYTPLTQYRSDPTKPIKVINLDRSTNRWEAMKEQMKRYPFLHYERFPAIEGKLFYDRFLPTIKNDYLQSPLNPGEVGIYLSTMEILYALTQDEENDYYLLLEDDTIFDPDMTSIETYIRDAPASWDVLYLGINKNGKCRKIDTEYSPLNAQCMPGNFAVVFRKRAAQYYLNFAFPIVCPIDVMPMLCHSRLNYMMIDPKKAPIQANYVVDSTITTGTNIGASSWKEGEITKMCRNSVELCPIR